MTQLKGGGCQPRDREEHSSSASTVIARWQEMAGTSRVNREVYARFCGRLEVKSLRPTRHLWSALADDGLQGLVPLRTHLTRRPRRDTFLPEQKLVELRISAVGGSCGLRYDRGRTVAPAELGAVNPHAV